ncbi:MAG: AAA family ATPase [Candidatus Nanopelagicales bacterium]
MPKSRTIAVANQKGGVAKTTTVASLGAALAELGERVLLVDLDPQACLTFSLGIDPEDLTQSMYQVMLAGLAVAEVVLPTDDGVDLLPATIDLAAAEALLFTRDAREHVLRHAIAGLVDSYDWVILDCPPSLGLLTVNALTAADEVLVPLQCETLSHRGVGQLVETVKGVQRQTNPRLVISGVIPTLYDGRTSHTRAVLADIGDRYHVRVLEPPIARSVRFAEAPAMGRSVLATASGAKGAAAYRLHAIRMVKERANTA